MFWSLLTILLVIFVIKSRIMCLKKHKLLQFVPFMTTYSYINAFYCTNE